MGLEKFINNTYKLASSDNMGPFLDAMNVPAAVKGSILSTTPTVTLKGCGGNYTLQTRGSFKDRDITFVPGVEFEDTGLDGKPIRCIMTVNGAKLTREVLTDPKSTIVSEMSDNQINVTLTGNGVTAKQVFKKV